MFVAGECVVTFSIRRYTPQDEADVADLWSRASKRAHPFIAGEGEGERLKALRENYLPHAANWVALDENDRAVGLLGLLETDEGAQIGGLFVAPEAQGKGIGRMLVDHAARLKGSLRLEVFEKNAAARRFYARMGFQEAGSRPDPDTGHVLITMSRPARRWRPR